MAVPFENLNTTQIKMSPFEGKEICDFPDRSGNVLKLQRYNGVYCHYYYDTKILDQIADVELRPDDIYLCAYPRTGQHWTFEMTSMLLNGHAETVKKYKGRNQVDFVMNEELNKISSPRVLPAHVLLSRAPRDLKKKKCKIIYLLRDPRDVAVSIFHVYIEWKMYTGDSITFEDFLPLFLEGKVENNGLFCHLLQAERFFDENPDIPVHFMAYEETIKDPVKAVQQLSDFLGLQRDDLLCQAIADKCHFSKMVEDKRPYSRIVDGKSILYRQGKSGDWRNYFSEEMLEEYFRVYEEKMKGSRFYQRYSRETECL